MGNALINFTQGSTTGGAGFALMGVLSTSVVVSNGDDSNIVNWEFIVDDVGVGSSVPQGTVQDGATSTWSFAPDATGCYVVTLITTDNQGNLYQDTRCFGVLENSGRFIPSYLATDEALNFTVSMVTNTKGWSPFLQAYLKAVDAGGGGGGGTYTQDCTGGGTVAYSGPNPPPPIVFLTGTPGAGFNLSMGTDAFATTFMNATGQLAFIQDTGHIGIGVNVANGTTVQATKDATHAVVFAAVGSYVSDIAAYNGPDGVEQGIKSIAHPNNNAVGAITYVPIYGPYVGFNDFESYLGSPPVTFLANSSGLGSGPNASPVAEPVTVVWYTEQSGSIGFDGGFQAQDGAGGAFATLLPSTYYPGTAWTTQSQGELVLRTGDEITGTSQSVSHFFPLLSSFSQTVYKFTIVMTAKPNTVGSGTMVTTDFASAEMSVTVSSLTGTARECVAPTTIVSPTNGSSTNLSDMTLVVGVSANVLVVTVTSSSNAGPTDTTDFQLKITAEVE